ncbi:unnamed protein product [Didymodactylos carnosus]|uniref:Integrase catalytic domain-containing protein n=1 Tax=Didymodactylos carnosus TaxID=1234261 RepID=A0A814TAU5_9BILA|nr:unnamed protein product [Didymodactylos carnosus]CAF3920958.1 unnamed protein product [Didymodactylos carnosus]
MMSTSPPSSPFATNLNTIDRPNDSTTTSAPDTTTKYEAVDNFKQAEETLLKIIPVLDCKQADNLLDYWQEFKKHLHSFFNQTSSNIPSTTKTVTFSSLSSDETEQEHYQQDCDIQKQRAAEIQQALGAIPRFKRDGAEEWFSDRLLRIPKTFTDKENVSSRLEEIEQQFTTSKWPEDSRLQYIPQFLRNEARQWYKENKTKITTWSQFKTDIKHIHLLKQYYAEILKLCKEADIQMSEQMKLQYLLDNLKPSIKIKVIEKSPKTTAQFLEYAKTVEDLRTLISSDPNLSHFASDNVTATSTTSRSNTSLKVYIPPPRRSNSNQTQQEQSFPTSTEPQSLTHSIQTLSSSEQPPSKNTHSSFQQPPLHSTQSSSYSTSNLNSNRDQYQSHSNGWDSRGARQRRGPHFHWRMHRMKLLTEAPLFLHFPVDKHPVILSTDAAKNGISGVLQQEINSQMYNLYYHSQLINQTQQRYDTGAKEALAIALSFNRMRQFVLGREIIIYTDHCPLCGMHQKSLRNTLANLTAVTTRLQAKRQQQQQILNTTTIDTDLDENLIDSNDSSDKISTDKNNIDFVPFGCNNFDIRKLKNEQDKDTNIQKIIEQLNKNKFTKINFVLKNGILYKLVQFSHSQRKKQLPYIPIYMIKDLLRAAHDDPISSHFGFHRTYLKLKHQYWWPNMKSSIEKYIKSCSKCQQFNISRQKKPGLLHPITSLDGPFQMIAIDYVGPLPRTPSENRYVFAITDMFTRWVTAVALPSCTAQVTAEALFKHYICRYGVPVSILSDNGTHFRNQLLQSLEYKIGINYIFSTPYHPQSNGVIERFNATFIPQIAKLQDMEHNNWDEYLDAVVFAYNTGTHSITKFSPFELQFGRKPRLPTDFPRPELTFFKPNDYFAQLNKSLKIYHKNVTENIFKQQRLSKVKYNQNRQDPHYDIGDPVLLTIQGSRSKLDPRFHPAPKIIVKTQHPTYFVKDEDTQEELQVHVNDLRAILEAKLH